MKRKLKLAFCLFKYFPFGGLQINFMNISKECIKRGYHIDVYTITWDGEKPEWLNITIVPVSGFSNHKRYQSFAKRFNERYNKKQYDAVVGFNKMPGLDVYYAADVLYAAKMKDRSFFHHITNRYNTLIKLEYSVFRQDAKTQILLLTPKERQLYKDYYKTASGRFHIMPPGISTDCIPPANHEKIRMDKRNELDIDQDQIIILMVCINFKIKGVDRAIRALSSLPENLLSKCVLLVAGIENPGPYKRLAKKENVLRLVKFIGARKDVPALLMASDLLIHPARIENTGTVIVEALAANLPVITTDICGYSFHVISANAGKVIKSPFMQKDLDKALLSLLTSKNQNQWRRNAKNYIEKTDVFSRALKAVDVIEEVCA